MPETKPEREPSSGGSSWLPHRAALLPGFVLFTALLGFGGFNAFVALYARELGLDGAGFLFTLLALTVVGVRLVGRRIPDRFGAHRAATGALVLLLVGLATIGAWRSVAGLVVGTAVFALGQSLAYPSILTLAVRRGTPAERGAIAGSVSAFVDLAIAVGAIALGAVAAGTDYPTAFLVAAGVAASGLLLLARLRPA